MFLKYGFLGGFEVFKIWLFPNGQKICTSFVVSNFSIELLCHVIPEWRLSASYESRRSELQEFVVFKNIHRNKKGSIFEVNGDIKPISAL